MNAAGCTGTEYSHPLRANNGSYRCVIVKMCDSVNQHLFRKGIIVINDIIMLFLYFLTKATITKRYIWAIRSKLLKMAAKTFKVNNLLQ